MAPLSARFFAFPAAALISAFSVALLAKALAMAGVRTARYILTSVGQRNPIFGAVNEELGSKLVQFCDICRGRVEWHVPRTKSVSS